MRKDAITIHERASFISFPDLSSDRIERRLKHLRLTL